MIGHLPTILEVNGTDHAIRSDFRDVLNILCAYSDPELENAEKVYITLFVLYEDFEQIPEEDYEAAFNAAMDFIDYGQRDGKPSPHVMDWEQDESIMFPAVNKVAGFETRAVEYLHWWTFVGYYMAIDEGLFSTVVSLRLKKAKGKKMEKWEREFWTANKDLCLLRPKLTQEQKEAKDRLRQMFKPKG